MNPTNEKGICVLIIGSEISQGFVVDSNTSFISSEMFKLGIPVKEIRTIPDNFDQIKSVMKELLKKGDFLVTTGGLGPTDDDLTVDAICSVLKLKTEIVEACRKRVEKLIFKNKPGHPHADRILRQCRIPQGAKALPNASGLAPGIFLKQPGIISLPGFPEEIKSIWPHVLKIISSEIKQSFLSRSFTIWGIPESQIYGSLKIPGEITYGNHSLPWGNRFFIKASPDNKKLLSGLAAKITRIFQANILDDPVHQWFLYLKKNNLTFSTIESCTGGFAAKLITDIPGASEVYPGSIVTYDNEIKMSLTDVSPKTLESWGAVSRQTAREMAYGGSRKLGSDITISVTGIAGPGGGSNEKPVGTVFYGIYNRPDNTLYTGTGNFPFGRDRFRRAVTYTIYLALYHRYVYFKDESAWLNSPQGKNFIKEKDY